MFRENAEIAILLSSLGALKVARCAAACCMQLLLFGVITIQLKNSPLCLRIMDISGKEKKSSSTVQVLSNFLPR